MDEFKNRIENKQEEYIQFLKKLIGFDTSVIRHGEDGQEYEAQQWMARYLDGLGCEVEMFEPDNERMKSYPGYNAGHSYHKRPNVSARYRGSGGGKSLILNGHMDTMPAGDLERWKYDPWEMTEEDGKLYGLGTDDMKGGLSAAVLALELVLSMGYEPKGDIIILSVVDEEGGGNGSLACVDRGITADGVIIAEGTNMEVFPVNRGAWLGEVEVDGKPIHASLKGFGESAIDKMVKIMNTLYELEAKWMATKRHPLLAPITFNMGYIHGGVAASTVPDHCMMKFEIDYYPSEIDKFGNWQKVDKHTVVREVEDYVYNMAKGDPWMREHMPRFTWFQDCSPFETQTEHPLVQKLADAAGEVTGRRVITGMSAGCDARHFTNIAGIPTVVFGPGSCHNAHVYNEYLPKKQFFQAIETYAKMIVEWTR
ncbi:ArgE/DapE family deacylase [Faecalicatena sp. AGMB00832]|uniref:ArgE/DapE family deacylase n=1 Tax=Faecalicatena faecalis TaxID=2726362 RepID=A0ABS6D1W2_9FIRM|nr:ArgE/DapE family deacylase [Faecalicatena faecalis]MBU3875585.1 ArgE/DapE family deacylase [Faecalicatena faecalis]